MTRKLPVGCRKPSSICLPDSGVCRIPAEERMKTTMEMTGHGRRGKPNAGFAQRPQPLGNRCSIPTVAEQNSGNWTTKNSFPTFHCHGFSCSTKFRKGAWRRNFAPPPAHCSIRKCCPPPKKSCSIHMLKRGDPKFQLRLPLYLVFATQKGFGWRLTNRWLVYSLHRDDQLRTLSGPQDPVRYDSFASGAGLNRD